MAPDQAWVMNPDVAHREIEGQLLFLTPDDDVLYTLNGTGKRVWELFAAGAGPGAIAATLVATYGIPAAQAERDVAAFFTELAARGVVTPRA
jgi:hypothetical protein